MSNAYTPSCCRSSSSNSHGVRRRTWAGRLAAVALTVAPLPAAALPEDADQPIHIQADSAEYDQNGNRVVYRGSVRVNQGTLQVTAELMTIELQDGTKVIRITAEDTPAHYQQQVEADKGLVKAQAKTIVYHTQDERVDLKGEANLEQEGSTLSGDVIVYDIVAGKVDATAEDDAPVRMVLQPSATKITGSEPSDDEQQ